MEILNSEAKGTRRAILDRRTKHAGPLCARSCWNVTEPLRFMGAGAVTSCHEKRGMQERQAGANVVPIVRAHITHSNVSFPGAILLFLARPEYHRRSWTIPKKNGKEVKL